MHFAISANDVSTRHKINFVGIFVQECIKLDIHYQTFTDLKHNPIIYSTGYFVSINEQILIFESLCLM